MDPCSDPFWLFRAVIRSFYRHIIFPHQRHRLNQTDVISLLGLDLVIFPGVFHPILFQTGYHFAKMLHTILAELKPQKVLDMGTGSGVNALVAARYALSVDAVDINSNAVACARENFKRNGVDHRITPFVGNLFDSVPGKKYDVILFNPPFYRGVTFSEADKALYGGPELETIQHFADDAPNHLEHQGRIYLLLSTAGHCREIVQIMEARGFVCERLRCVEIFLERLFLFDCRPASS